MTKNKKPKKPKKIKTIWDYPKDLRGPSNNKWGGNRYQTLQPYAGSTFGAASPCQTLTTAERREIAAKLGYDSK